MAAGAREVVRLILAGDASGLEGAVGKAEGAGGRMRAVGATIAAAGAAMAATGFSVGAAWESSRDQIIATTGATGDRLKALQADVRGLAQDGFGLEPATRVITEVNRHLGLTGDEARGLGAALLKSGADAGKFSTASKQLGLDAAGAQKFLDQLAVASQRSGVSIDDLSDEIVDRAGDWDEGGASMEHLASTVVQAALEFGHGGLETSLGLASEMVTKGMIPAVVSLEDSLGSTTGAVAEAAAESLTWRDSIRKTKDSLVATIAPYGDVIGAVGSMASAIILSAPQIIASAGPMWAVLTGPVGLVVLGIAAVGAAAWYFRDELTGAFMAVLDYVRPWVETFLGYVETAVGWIPGVGDNLSAMVGSARTKLGEFTTVMADAGQESGEAFVGPILSAVDDPETGVAPSLVGSILAAENDAKSAAAAVASKTAEAFTERFSSSLADARAAGRWIQGPITLEIAEVGLQLSSTPLAGIDMLGIGAGAERAARVVDTRAGEIEQRITDAGSESATGFMDRLTGILGGGSGGSGIEGFFTGALGGVSGILSQFLNGDWKSTLSSMVSMGLNTLVPGLGTIANQAFAAFKTAWDWFKKPSETELAARETWHTVGQTVVDTLRRTQEFSAEVDRAMADGWDRSTAEMRAAFVLYGQQAGLTYDESFDAYATYEQAVRDGDVELAEQMLATLQGWEEKSGTTWATNVETADTATGAIQGSIDAVRGKDVSINVSHHTTYSSSGSSGEPGGEGGGEGEGFKHGTGGLFRQFGAGTPIVGHGEEAIVPRFTVPTLAGDIADALASIVPVGATAGGPPVVIADVRIGDSELDRIADESMRRQERVLDFRGRA